MCYPVIVNLASMLDHSHVNHISLAGKYIDCEDNECGEMRLKEDEERLKVDEEGVLLKEHPGSSA